MTDILTQLQTTYDQLLTQFFSTTSYLSQRHPLLPPHPDPSDPYTNPPLASDPDSHTLKPGPEDHDPAKTAHPLHPVSEETFAQSQVQLAEDLVRKGRQIEYLISRLPGGERTSGDQEGEVRRLVGELREVERERKRARRERRALVRRLEGVVGGMGTNVELEGEMHCVNGHR